MRAAPIVVLAFLAAAGVVGVLDRQSAEVSRGTAMEAPRPLFEPVHDLRQLSMPCTYMHGGYLEPISPKNTRCVNADKSWHAETISRQQHTEESKQ